MLSTLPYILMPKDDLFVLFCHYRKPEEFWASKAHLEESKTRRLVREKKNSRVRALEFTELFEKEIPKRYLIEGILQARG